MAEIPMLFPKSHTTLHYSSLALNLPEFHQPLSNPPSLRLSYWPLHSLPSSPGSVNTLISLYFLSLPLQQPQICCWKLPDTCTDGTSYKGHAPKPVHLCQPSICSCAGTLPVTQAYLPPTLQGFEMCPLYIYSRCRL